MGVEEFNLSDFYLYNNDNDFSKRVKYCKKKKKKNLQKDLFAFTQSWVLKMEL